MSNDPATKVTQILRRPDGAEARIVAHLFGQGHNSSIDVCVHKRSKPSDPWVLCNNRPHYDWRAMSVDEYLKSGRSEMLQTVTHAEILKVTNLLGRPIDEVDADTPSDMTEVSISTVSVIGQKPDGLQFYVAGGSLRATNDAEQCVISHRFISRDNAYLLAEALNECPVEINVTQWNDKFSEATDAGRSDLGSFSVQGLLKAISDAPLQHNSAFAL